MKKFHLFVLMLAMVFVFAGCAVKTGNDKLEDASNASVSEAIKKGQTTKDEVRKLFGEPANVDFMANGLEKWTYTHERRSAKAVNYVPVANWFVSGTNDTTKNLVILFQDNTVENFAVSTAQGETKGGLFQ